jgi:hypothetical protein
MKSTIFHLSPWDIIRTISLHGYITEKYRLTKKTVNKARVKVIGGIGRVKLSLMALNP